MASEPRRRWITSSYLTWAIASLSTGVLFFFGTGLEPKWFITWLASLPVLVLAPRISGKATAAVAFTGYLLGTLNVAGYYLDTLELPIPLVAGIFTVTSAIFCGAAILFRTLLLQDRLLLAVVTFGSLFAGAEYVLANAVPGGANWSLAPTQAEFLPMVQLASVTGIWGVSFLVAVTPAAVAVILTRRAPTTGRLRVGIAAAAVLATSLSYGFVQLDKDHRAPSVHVALLAARLPAPEPILDVSTSEGLRLLEADLAALANVPPRTQIVVLPEKDLIVDEISLVNVSRRFTEVARNRGLTVVVGVEMHTPKANYNEALIFSPDGSQDVYKKQFMLPGVEDSLTTGHANSFVSGYARRIGVAICADMGHPQLGRSYAREGAQLMVVPALDFTKDALSQSRVQYLRGVENGYSVARAARLGNLTLADANGRVVEQAKADNNAPVSVISTDLPLGPGKTLYSRWGDWFAWLALIVTVVGVAVSTTTHTTRHRRRGIRSGEESDG